MSNPPLLGLLPLLMGLLPLLMGLLPLLPGLLLGGPLSKPLLIGLLPPLLGLLPRGCIGLAPRGGLMYLGPGPPGRPDMFETICMEGKAQGE